MLIKKAATSSVRLSIFRKEITQLFAMRTHITHGRICKSVNIFEDVILKIKMMVNI